MTICAWCRGGAHGLCLRAVCGCVHETDPWLSPERRAALRSGVMPVDDLEAGFQTAFYGHRAARAAADERRA